MPYTFAQRHRILAKARRKIGLKKDAQDRRIFMEQCMSEMMESGEAEDSDDARTICELLYEEEQELYDEED